MVWHRQEERASERVHVRAGWGEVRQRVERLLALRPCWSFGDNAVEVRAGEEAVAAG